MTSEQERRANALLKCPRSLEDFLISHPLTVDGQLDDGWGARFPVKGREIEAAIMFADISSFTARTENLSPTETLIFVNGFLAWVTAEALGRRPAVVDKYIGDEMMLIFSKAFGSDDPFADAVDAARWMGEFDALSFCPHIGIACGLVTVGFVGTEWKYNCSVFGRPVVTAKRCAGQQTAGSSVSIVFPACEMKGRSFEQLVPPAQFEDTDGTIRNHPEKWHPLPARTTAMKGLPEIEIMEIVSESTWLPSETAEERAKRGLAKIAAAGGYRPQRNAQT